MNYKSNKTNRINKINEMKIFNGLLNLGHVNVVWILKMKWDGIGPLVLGLSGWWNFLKKKKKGKGGELETGSTRGEREKGTVQKFGHSSDLSPAVWTAKRPPFQPKFGGSALFEFGLKRRSFGLQNSRSKIQRVTKFLHSALLSLSACCQFLILPLFPLFFFL